MQTTTTTATELKVATPAEARSFFDEVRAGLAAGKLAPYLGPAVCATYAGGAVPGSYDELAAFFAKRVALPKRARGNPWASAQYVEGQKHRSTVTKMMSEAYGGKVEPRALHTWLASLPLPLIVDTWYDGTFRTALSGRSDWLEIQGISRAGIGEFRWYRAYTPDGTECPVEQAKSAATLLYKPHGGVPQNNFLISDADYVEVLTEIDIQTPIPEIVRTLRSSLGFVFLGCRFHDQLLRTYARQITKRSAGPHYAVIDPGTPYSKNELKFLKELDVKTIILPNASAFEQLPSS